MFFFVKNRFIITVFEFVPVEIPTYILYYILYPYIYIVFAQIALMFADIGKRFQR